MRENICEDFQETVREYLIRHQSILDIISKSQETNAYISRALTKAITQCGCIELNSKKINLPESSTISDIKDAYNSQLKGNLCSTCSEIIEQELGKNLFYIVALCNALELDLEDILLKENKKVKALGRFNCT
ncbi:hypothetical protein SAMN00017405_2348 [Desulfonispora thiosulfatigenes DSM 11270]|uniref:DUF1573 domain-containing protein n=1 Tax=Desulfonispora thiosulfatigenes DSM 11270 TaxID=656914 RepID=A0A1W1UTN4_DESTI|nr:DUF1573 domain-containing protein [Desulfonispora thiosulfatigenes]SMB84495.1 hypothetical protein SAMN00017405_2348 [Desulfonispora thiosulfatigenes DSM 11270]